ncbi:MAG: C45 family peptidase, partial [Gammaproteobacteria bacterium]|nr:C45 family peptidase [Gammaproteobacteria bacterium]
LVRNYDYEPRLCEGTLLHTAWNDRRVIAMSDCLWGVLDGMNEDGLVVSLTFGGRRVVGDGFGVPIILRYILEFCTTTQEAVDVLLRVPIHMAYNVTVIDRAATFRTLYLSPDRIAVVRQLPATTNHQGRVEWHAHARATATIERERYLFSRIADGDETPSGLVGAFLSPPLHNSDFSKGFGTLYTAVYRPRRARMELLWPGRSPWTHAFAHFGEGQVDVDLPLAGHVPPLGEPALHGLPPHGA